MSRILALTRSDLAVENDVDLVVPLFWAAPETLESLERRFHSRALPLAALIPDIGTLIVRATDWQVGAGGVGGGLEGQSDEVCWRVGLARVMQ